MTRKEEAVAAIRLKFNSLSQVLDERARRLWAATESLALGYGGDSAVSAATGLSRAVIRAGRAELERGIEPSTRVRRPGAGRPRKTVVMPGVIEALEKLIDPVTRGDPESPLRWTTKSCEKLADALTSQDFPTSSSTVWRLLRELGYRVQSTKKTLERRHHDDRDPQFEFINGAVGDFHDMGEPAISVDTKKKELVGDFANAGTEWQPSGQPEEVLSHDFAVDSVGKAVPYGVYDLHRNEALVNVGIDNDTSAFAVESIRQWWRTMGQAAYPGATKLLITADCGGSNGYRIRAWKTELQRLATESGLTIQVCHFPPGTSKWNKVEHRLFSYVSLNWRGRPLTTYETIVELIGHTTTSTGLRVKAVLDRAQYERGIRVSDDAMDKLNLTRSTWHGEWNYSLSPGGG
jgi:transposase